MRGLYTKSIVLGGFIHHRSSNEKVRHQWQKYIIREAMTPMIVKMPTTTSNTTLAFPGLGWLDLMFDFFLDAVTTSKEKSKRKNPHTLQK